MFVYKNTSKLANIGEVESYKWRRLVNKGFTISSKWFWSYKGIKEPNKAWMSVLNKNE